MEQLKKSAVANAIAIPLPLCFSCFVLLRRFRENLTKPFYFYLSRTCDSPGGTPSVISLTIRSIENNDPDNNCDGMVDEFYRWIVTYSSNTSTGIGGDNLKVNSNL